MRADSIFGRFIRTIHFVHALLNRAKSEHTDRKNDGSFVRIKRANIMRFGSKGLFFWIRFALNRC
jgi:hypothetical protein